MSNNIKYNSYIILLLSLNIILLLSLNIIHKSCISKPPCLYTFVVKSILQMNTNYTIKSMHSLQSTFPNEYFIIDVYYQRRDKRGDKNERILKN